MSGPRPRERRADEAYWRGRDEGYDRGYEEGRAGGGGAGGADRSVTPRSAPARRMVEAGVLLAGAILLWKALRTWPGRVVAVGVLLAFSGLVSLGAVVVAVLVGATVLGWALRTGERAVADVRAGATNLRGHVVATRRRTR